MNLVSVTDNKLVDGNGDVVTPSELGITVADVLTPEEIPAVYDIDDVVTALVALGIVTVAEA